MSREKQIEEMAEVMRHTCEGPCFESKDGFTDCEVCHSCQLYEAGYRKQSEGEWVGKGMVHCSECGNVVNFRNVSRWLYNFCPNCGASMKGGADNE